jgi:hypothetical protein
MPFINMVSRSSTFGNLAPYFHAQMLIIPSAGQHHLAMRDSSLDMVRS